MFPGDTKWNYSWSVGELKPDVAFMDWVLTEGDRQDLRAWGYAGGRLQDGYRVWPRLDSRLVNFAKSDSFARAGLGE